MKVCPRCGNINSNGSNNCSKCGTLLGASVHRSDQTSRNGISQSSNNRPVCNYGSPSGQQPTNYQPNGYQQNNRSTSQRYQRPVNKNTQQQNFSTQQAKSRNNKGINVFVGIALFIVLLLSVVVVFEIMSNKHMTDAEIDNAYGSGVVLIMNSGYYEVVLSNGESVYFTSYDEEGGLQNFTFDKDSVITAYSFGTGFFVSDDGKIATNNHVVASDVTDKQIKKQMKSLFSKIKEALSEKYDEYKELDAQLITAIKQKYLCDEDYSREYVLSDAVEEEMEKLQGIYKYIDDINPSDLELNYHSEVSVAYNDTYVTNMSDFSSCVVKSTDAEYDLAIIQLKEKKTPAEKCVFSVPNNNPLEDYSIFESLGKKFGNDKNSKLTMIGFNRGPQLAFTKEGIKAQCTSGSISQNDADKIMYTIPSLHGSSGSPVLNAKGQLVAVNFAGVDATQSFNYGVKIKHLKDLIDK